MMQAPTLFIIETAQCVAEVVFEPFKSECVEELSSPQEISIDGREAGLVADSAEMMSDRCDERSANAERVLRREEVFVRRRDAQGQGGFPRTAHSRNAG